MTMQMYLDEKLKERFDEVTEIARAKGIAEGREVGRQEGTAEGKAAMLKSAICTIADTFSPKELAQRFHISEDFVCQVLQDAGIAPKL